MVTNRRFTALASFASTAIVVLSLFPNASNAQATHAAGSHFEGFVAGTWVPCTVVGNQLPSGGFVLRCDALMQLESVFSETDVRSARAAKPDPAGRVGKPEETFVEGHVGNHWEPCTQIGKQLQTGRYVLRCEGTPEEKSVFAASDVRPRAGTARPATKPVEPVAKRQVSANSPEVLNEDNRMT